jgi:hypothetical protein
VKSWNVNRICEKIILSEVHIILQLELLQCNILSEHMHV